MVDLIIQWIICVFGKFLAYFFLGSVLPRRKQITMVTVIIFLMAGGTIQFFTNFYNNSSLNLFVNSILIILQVVIIFQADWRKVILYYLFICIINMSSEFITAMVYYSTVKIDTKEVISSPLLDMISRVVDCIIFTVVSKFLKRDDGEGKYLLFIKIMYPLVTALLLIAIIKLAGGVDQRVYDVEWICLLLMATNIISFQFIENAVDMVRKKERYQRVAEINALNIERFKELEREERAWKVREHDLTKNLSAIGGLAKEKRDEEILSVLEGMQLKIAEIKENDYINNSVINALLKVKLSEADREGIAIDFYAEPDMDFAGYEIGDIIAITGNQLDNAIEASRMCDGEKKIWARYYCAENKQIVLEMENNFTSVPRKSLGKFLTSKQDTTRHGMGLRIIQETAEKNGGFAENTVKDSVFRSVVVLPKER